MLWGIQRLRWCWFIYFSYYLNSLISGSVLQSCLNIQSPLFYFAFWPLYWTIVLGGRCLLPLSSSLTLSHQNVFSSYKHCHCSEQTNGSFKLIFHIWKQLILTTSWRSMKHFHFFATALVPILIIEPYCFNFSFQLGLCSDSFHPPWTQEHSYLFHLENKTSKKPFPYLSSDPILSETSLV